MSKTVSDIVELVSAYYPKVRKVFRNLVSIKDIPITMTQLTCLNVLDKQERMSMSVLAEELCMSNQQLTKVVDALVGFEMAERTYDAANRRKIFAKITPKGKQVLTDLRQELDRKMAHIMRKFSDDEMDRLYQSVAHIASFFGHNED